MAVAIKTLFFAFFSLSVVCLYFGRKKWCGHSWSGFKRKPVCTSDKRWVKPFYQLWISPLLFTKTNWHGNNVQLCSNIFSALMRIVQTSFIFFYRLWQKQTKIFDDTKKGIAQKAHVQMMNKMHIWMVEKNRDSPHLASWSHLCLFLWARPNGEMR